MDKVVLIPWDPTSEQQYQRLYDQRVACGWREDEVPEWKVIQSKGIKVLADDLPGRTELMDQHIACYPKEREPLVDTSSSGWKEPREPTNRTFNPIGHTAIERLGPEVTNKLCLPPSTVWLKHLYVSWALHGGGLGRDAMRQTERMVVMPPVNATMMGVDTIRKEFQVTEEIQKHIYDNRGKPRPQEVWTNEGWYMRQGYEEVDRPEFLEWKIETGRIEEYRLFSSRSL